MKELFNKAVNYPAAAVLWMIIFLILYFILMSVDINNNFSTLAILILSAMLAFGKVEKIPIQTSKLLLFIGEEVKCLNEEGEEESVWIGPGFYFMFLGLFSFAEQEHQDMEYQDVSVPEFEMQSKDKGISVEINSDWEISNHDNFKKQKKEKMESNLCSLLKRTTIRVLSVMKYNDILGNKDISNLIYEDKFFIKECHKYGVEFENIFLTIRPSDLKQENLNSYREELFQKEKGKYPANHKFTHQQIKDINESVEVQLKIAKKVITTSPTVGRFDIDQK